MRYLALDIGTRKTGVAYLDTAVGIPLPLETIRHASLSELVASLQNILSSRQIESIIVGLPRLPSGEEGSQAAVSREAAVLLKSMNIPIEFVDERYTTPNGRMHKNVVSSENYDGDAAAACALLGGKVGS